MPLTDPPGGVGRRRGFGGPLPWLGALLVAYLALPIAAFAVRFAKGSNLGFGAVGLWPATAVSVEASTISLALVTLFGVPLAYALAAHRGRIAAVVGVVVQLPLALPPLTAGILLLFVVGPNTTLGRFFDGRLTESLAGIVIAQSFVAAPFLVIAARSAFANVDPALHDVAATLGHRPIARFFTVDLRCAAGAIRAGMALAWLRAFGEFGANLILAYHPFSLPIYTENQFEVYPLSTTGAPTFIALVAAAVVAVLGQARLPNRPRVHGRALPAAQPPSGGATTPVGFDLDLRVGTFHLAVAHPVGASRLAVVGPSGSGKSLTLRAIAGLLGPGVGRVAYGAVDVTARVPERRGVGYVPQGLGLIPGLTVRQQAVFGRAASPGLAAWWLDTLHLDELLDRYPHQLSGGQRQRVSLARALATAPDLVLLDEPFSALDAPVRDELRRELRRLQHEIGLSTVLVTHDPEEAAFLADEIVVIAEGSVLQSGRVSDVYRRPVSGDVARLLGIPNVRTGVAGQRSLRAGSVELPVRFPDDVIPGTDVLWSIPPEDVVVVPGSDVRSAHPATVVDAVELGRLVEVTATLDSGPTLRSRRTIDPGVVVGDRCALVLDPDLISVWPAP